MQVIDMLNVLLNEQTTFGYIKYYDRRNKKYEIMLNCEENIINKLDQGNITLFDEIEGIVEYKEEPQEHKIPDKINYPHIEIESSADDEIRDYLYKVKDKIDEIIDYLEVNNDGKR